MFISYVQFSVIIQIISGRIVLKSTRNYFPDPLDMLEYMAKRQ